MGNAVAHASPVSLMFIEGDHAGIHASALCSSQTIARDKPPAAEQAKTERVLAVAMGF